MTTSAINLIAGYVLIGAIALTAPLTIAYLVALEMLFHRMRKQHPDHYKRIGEPSLFLNNSISKSIGVVRFLIDRDYLDMPDTRANQLGMRSRQLFVAAMSMFGVSLLAFAVMSVTF